jgi:hypothetical protein
MITILELKRQATILEDFLKQKNSAITHSSCLQALAKIHDFKDWNTMKSVLQKHEESQTASTRTNTKFEHDPSSIITSFEAKIRILPHSKRSQSGKDISTMLQALLFNLQSNSISLSKMTVIELLDEWSLPRIEQVLIKLEKREFIYEGKDSSGQEVIMINPEHFWKGDFNKRFDAIGIYHREVAINAGGFDIMPMTFKMSVKNSDVQTESSL